MPAGARHFPNETPNISSCPVREPLTPWKAVLKALNTVWLSIPLVRFLASIFSTAPRCTRVNMSLPAPVASAPVSVKNPPESSSGPHLTITALPDELVSMCYASLEAPDLVSLERVSRRLRALVSTDAVCWRRCAETRWAAQGNSSLLAAAAHHAGTWKALYAEKISLESTNLPWLVPSASETKAMFELIKGDMLPAPVFPVASKHSLGGASPRAVQEMSPESIGHGPLSVALLIDGSSSVTEDDFRAMKRFSEALVHSLCSTHPDARVALVQFNQHPKVESPLTPVQRPTLLREIATLDQMMGSTDIAAPIRRAREMLEEDAQHGRKAIVLLTDGQTHADELVESQREARLANKETDARVFTLGVGRDVDVRGLNRVATGLDEASPNASVAELAMGCYFALRCLQSNQ